MIKTYKYLLLVPLLLFGIYLISSCERDDICADGTATTPFLIIKFIDFETGIEVEAPSELEVQGAGMDDIYPLESVTDSILIPLRTDSPITEYFLTIDSDTVDDTTNIPNTDLLSIQYTPVEEYVSSACGFKVNFRGLTVSILENLDDPEDTNWIQNITIQRDDVTDETDAHIFIFH
ncbi:DUF6452 family protein [Aquimarina pacifica]|uniref:DUF6452 family protein n=1 Tax=Aquimarina pacifica TaxID=1296415 RepID=UPI000472ED99|nr:DUF6452 family protein [Aquimarina pacifica]